MLVNNDLAAIFSRVIAKKNAALHQNVGLNPCNLHPNAYTCAYVAVQQFLHRDNLNIF